MKYERLTKRKENGEYTLAKEIKSTYQVAIMEEADRLYAEAFRRLAELEDKIESGELISTLQEDQSEQEIEFFVKHNAYVRRQAEVEFADKLREKEFSSKMGSEWVVVVKSRDIDELVKEVRPKKRINAYHIVKIQAATMRLFEALDDDYPDGRAVHANERAIQHWLDKITDDEDEQREILRVIERENWNTEDKTFKPICDELRKLGYEIVEDKK